MSRWWGGVGDVVDVNGVVGVGGVSGVGGVGLVVELLVGAVGGGGLADSGSVAGGMALLAVRDHEREHKVIFSPPCFFSLRKPGITARERPARRAPPSPAFAFDHRAGLRPDQAPERPKTQGDECDRNGVKMRVRRFAMTNHSRYFSRKIEVRYSDYRDK